ncbi:hypothetical protein, partial [Klebsiella pneumoniae]|uniref:hypothetical protein n=1 Tax=Klebsiella pneumoniae TaxID=573 RepID=UPI0019550EED
VSSHKQLLGNTQNSRHRYAASTSGNPSFSVLRQLQYLCELTHYHSDELRVFLTRILKQREDFLSARSEK